MKAEVSLPRSEQLPPDTCLEPEQSSPFYNILSIQDLGLSSDLSILAFRQYPMRIQLLPH
jgi:hypothetical protein